jgi:tRNA(adenine34) deaminase
MRNLCNDIIIHEKYMKFALEEAEKAFAKGEVPVGAVIVKGDKIIAKAHNKVEEKGSTLYHAEIIAIENACREINNKYLDDCTLYVTLEPCTMCSGAIMNSRISRVVYGADEEKSGTAGTVLNLLQFPSFPVFVHIIPNILKDESAELLKKFFQFKRN